jgi:hypothetical protein
LLNGISGTLEVYWEQFRRFAQNKRRSTPKTDFDCDYADDTDGDGTDNDRPIWTTTGQKIHPLTTTNRAEARTKFIEGNVVFG